MKSLPNVDIRRLRNPIESTGEGTGSRMRYVRARDPPRSTLGSGRSVLCQIGCAEHRVAQGRSKLNPLRRNCRRRQGPRRAPRRFAAGDSTTAPYKNIIIANGG